MGTAVGRRGRGWKVVVLAALATMAGMVACVVVYFAFWVPGRNTVYAEGYSEEAFASVRAGDTEAQVLARLGPPLVHNAAIPGYEPAYLRYTAPKGPSENFLLRALNIEDGHVTRVYSETWYD